ncbi:hypothetical protein O181_006747 [Austropuccinia psidii MF-1]|uniref:Uncharacterized protein n=1 Tax=Austropuccinia psidii MF-1 TaxID=1389203 RepID=A0A9Q3BKL3_9BASI|nr:hypothetical protein [Austropuccinia psidii MF-1]
MEYIKPLLQLLEASCGELHSEILKKNLVLSFHDSIRAECQCWASKTNPNWASAFNAATVKITKYIDEEICNKDSLIACLLDPQYCQSMLNQMGIPHSQYQPTLDALSGKYYYHIEQLTNENENDSLHKTPSFPKNKIPNSILKIIIYYANIPNYRLTRSQVRLFANCQNNDVMAYLNNNWPVAPEEDIVTYWKVSLYVAITKTSSFHITHHLKIPHRDIYTVEICKVCL